MIEYTVRVYPSGNKYWYLNDKLHREDGPAIERANGDKEWYLNGEAHREDGPAVEWASGDNCWYLNDVLHREDGPAIECANGYKYWFLNGVEVTEDMVMGKPINKGAIKFDKSHFSQGLPTENGHYLVYGASFEFPTLLQVSDGSWKFSGDSDYYYSLRSKDIMKCWLENWNWVKIPKVVEDSYTSSKLQTREYTPVNPTHEKQCYLPPTDILPNTPSSQIDSYWEFKKR